MQAMREEKSEGESKMKLPKAIIHTICKLIDITILVSAGFLFGQGWEAARPKPLPSLKEIQERIGAEPDGIWGPETETKWDKKICEQYAAQYDYLYQEKK